MHNINEFKKHQLPTMRDLLSKLFRPLNDAEEYVSFFLDYDFFFLLFFFFFIDRCWIHKLVEEG
jgi:hypothetical protein